MKQCHLPPDQRPSGHLPELYIDAESMVDAGHATLEEMDLITLGFGIIVDGMTNPEGGCVSCGLAVFERIGNTPGIVEAAMRVSAAAALQLQITSVIAVSKEYDCTNVAHRKDAFGGLAEHWSFVVTKMRTCGLDCDVCINLGPAWPSQIGNHGH